MRLITAENNIIHGTNVEAMRGAIQSRFFHQQLHPVVQEHMGPIGTLAELLTSTTQGWNSLVLVHLLFTRHSW